MVIKWYNRDRISDVDMRQAKAVADRLLGKEEEIPTPSPDWLESMAAAFSSRLGATINLLLERNGEK